MQLVFIICALLLIPATLGSCIVRDALFRHLDGPFSVRRHYRQQANKDNALTYISSIFRNIAQNSDGVFYNQTFTQEQSPGRNIILILKGTRWGKSEDQVSLIGTHFDTVVNSPGVDDNGSGMAVLLEVAKRLNVSSCQRTNTIIIVAFDFEELGLTGSRLFVNDQLVPAILEKHRIKSNNFVGAFIMDSVLNYDNTTNSQSFPQGFEWVFPEVIPKMTERKFAGDFIASIGREDDKELMKLLRKYWDGSDDKDETYRLIDVAIPFSGRPSDNPLSAAISDLFRSDHYNFWNYNGNYTGDGLKAVFLTDTTEFRGYMKRCYHQECDDMGHVGRERLDFMARLGTALTRSLLEISSGRNDCTC